MKNDAGTILTVSSCICTAATAYFGIQAGLKLAKTDTDDKKEVVKACLPVGLACAGAIGFGVAADISYKKDVAALVNTCLVGGVSYMNYREEVVKRYGEEVDADIIATTIASDCAYHCTNYDKPDIKVHWIFNPCCEELPKFEFDAYERDVIHAEYHFNRNYVLRGGGSITDLLEFFGNADAVKDLYAEFADNLGWGIDDNEIYFVDFEHREIEGCDKPTFEIMPVFMPYYFMDEM